LRELAKKISKLAVVISKQSGEEGRIFGTVTTQEIAEALTQNGVEVSRRKIRVVETINRIGSYSAEIKLHAEVTAQLKFTVEAIAAPAEPATEAAAE
jgi:large subunit ribosomal protein L9